MINQTRSKKFSSLTRPATLQRLGLFLTAVACLAFGSFAHAQTASAYRFQEFRNFYSYAGGISNSQVVVGTIYDAPEFSGSAGAVRNLITHSSSKVSDKNFEYEFFSAVNTSNVVVGDGRNGNSAEISQAFILRDGSYTLLKPKGSGGLATSSDAYGINDAGVVVGQFDDKLGRHGFVLQNGIYTVLDVPGMIETIAFGINNLGVITVQATASNGRVNSYLYHNGTYTLLNVPGAQSSYIRGINDLGMIIFGYGTTGTNPNKSKVYYRGQFTELAYPGSSITFAKGINNAGVITGDADYPFVAYPIR